jgi:hypothetical protein
MRSTRTPAWLLALSLAGGAAAAQGPTEQWVPFPFAPTLNGNSAITTWDPDGDGPVDPRIAVGTDTVNPPAYGPSVVAAWDGVAWTALGNLFGQCHALASFQGVLHAAGSFQLGPFGNVPLVRWTGVAWQPVPLPQFQYLFDSWALTHFEGDLVAGSHFRVARFDGNAWQQMGGPLNDRVHAFTFHGGQLIAGGSFTSIGGVPCNHLARWDGVQWSPLGAGVDHPVFALANYQGELIAAGSFVIPHPGFGFVGAVSRWNGLAWQPMGGPLGEFVSALAVFGGRLFAAGVVNGLPHADYAVLASWSGSGWDTVQPHFNSSAALALLTDRDRLWLAGGFRPAGEPYTNVMRWTTPFPDVELRQPGPGQSVLLHHRAMNPGHVYRTLFAPSCAGPAGSGPSFGLCFPDPAILGLELAVPVGNAPFHFVAASAALDSGPYPLPIGLAIDVVALDVSDPLHTSSSLVERFVVE